MPRKKTLPIPETKQVVQHNISPEILGMSIANEYARESIASFYPQYYRTMDGTSQNTELNYLKYNNLINRSSIFSEYNGFWNIRNSVILCQTAYREVPVFQQTIETMTVIANTPIIWRGGSDAGRKFTKVWWEKVNGFNLNEQCFRELFRSSNLFLYRYDGSIKSNKINKFVLADKTGKQKVEAAKSIDIPVKYEVLNPADINIVNDISFGHEPTYYRFFDVSTKQRLSSLLQNKDVNISITEELKEALKQDYSVQKLELSKLSAIFYHKQDYEPFAMPMGYPVLEDINLKLEFKKCDAIVSKTVESIIMLVTHGEEPDKGGMNPLVDSALKQVFKTKQTGRTLISDYTTKIDFIIPDLKKVLGPDKYQKLDQDINDGLMNIFFGDQKFANIMVKLRVFVTILNYAQELLLNEFIAKEVKRVGKLVGYKEEDIPTPKFKKIQLEDPSQTNRIIAQLAQLGLLTAEETFDVMENGILPNSEESVKSQESYKKLREKDMYYPLVGGSDDGEEVAANGRPKGTGTKKKTSKVGFKGSSSGSFNPLEFRKNILLANETINKIEQGYKLKFNKNKLIEKDMEIIKIVSSHLIINESSDKWLNSVDSYLHDKLPEPNIENLGLVEEIKEEYNIDDLTAGILLWSR